MSQPIPSSVFQDQPSEEINTLPSPSDAVFDGEVLDLHQLPAPVSDEEQAVHAAARTKFAVLADMIERQGRGEAVNSDDFRIAESDATELLLAYKRLLTQRVG
ncbi:MAG: hypothetical protein ACR2M1_15135 [Gemmatimonadaceae bacterium]